MALGKDNGLFIKMVTSLKDMWTKTVREDSLAKAINEIRLEKFNKTMAPLHELILKQQIEVKKLEKPPTGFDNEGKEVERLRTKEEHEAKKKAEERLEKLLKAYEKAMETGDLSDANNFVQQSGGKGGGAKEGDSAKETA